VLSIGQLISWGSLYYAFALLIEPMSAELGLSRTALSGAYSVGLLVSGVAAWPVGVLIDRGHARWVMSAGSVLGALALAAHATVTQTWALYAVWCAIGVAMSCTLYDPAFAMLVRVFPQDYRSRITVLTLLGGLASTVFWPLTAWLVAQTGWRGALWAMAAMHVLACLPIHLLCIPRDAAPRPIERVPTGTPGAVAAGSGTGGSKTEDPDAGTPVDAQAAGEQRDAHRRLFVVLVLSFATNLVVMAAIAAHLPAMLAAAGLGVATALSIVATIGPMQVAGRLLLLLAQGRLSPTAATRVIVWLPPAGLLSIGLLAGLQGMPGPAAITLGFLGAWLYGAGNGMLTIVKGTAVADLIGPARVATLNGIAAVPSAFARALGPFMVAWIWEGLGSLTGALASLLLCSIASAWLLTTASRLGTRS
jgi:hypothetical protein